MPVDIISVAAKAAVLGSVALSGHAHHAADQHLTVKSGDTLSALASTHQVPGGWQSLYAANSKKIKDPNLIFPDENLIVPDHAMKAAVTTAVVSTSSPSQSNRASDQDSCTPNCPWGDGDKDGMDKANSPFANAPAPVQSAPVASVSSDGESDGSTVHHYHHHSYSSASSSNSGTYHGSSSMQQCIISRESGGNPNVMNSSGHYGLYQFSASTWAASGGNPASFGNASVAEQNQVFANAVAARGYSDWTPYDGC